MAFNFGTIGARFTLDPSPFEQGAQKVEQRTRTMAGTLAGAQARFKGVQSGFTAAAASANAFAGALGGTASKITSFAGAAGVAFGAGGPWAIGIGLAIGAVTTLASSLVEAKTKAEEAAAAGAAAFDKESESVRTFVAEMEKAAAARNVALAGGDVAAFGRLTDEREAAARLSEIQGRAAAAEVALGAAPGFPAGGAVPPEVALLKSRADAAKAEFEAAAASFLQKFGETAEVFRQRTGQTGLVAGEPLGIGAPPSLKLGTNTGTLGLTSGRAALAGTGGTKGIVGGEVVDLEAVRQGNELVAAKSALIQQEIALYAQLRAAQQAQSEAFLTGQQEAIRSYEDLMVAGDEQARIGLDFARQEEQFRAARAAGYLSEAQLLQALIELEKERKKASEEAAARATEKDEATESAFVSAGVSAGSSFAHGIKSFFDSHDPLDLFQGLLSAASGILSLLGPLGAGFGGGLGILASLFHSGGGVGARMVTAHSGMPLGPRLRNDELLVKAQTGEGFLSRAGRGSMSDAELDYRNRTGRAPGGGGGTVNIYSMSLDTPDFSAFAPRTFEPVIKRRMDDRKGSLYRRSLERAVRPRRAS